MTITRNLLLGTALATACIVSQAQTVQTTGSLVVVPATGELTVPNDQVRATLQVEEEDKDKAAAASRVNQKMKQGIELLKRQDPQATLKSYGYYTYAVYAEPPAAPVNPQSRTQPKPRPIVGWRVGQYLEMTTQNLGGLPKTVSSVQSILNLNGLQFGLSPATGKKLDADLIDATYKNLGERVGFIAKAMQRPASDAVIETLDFEGSGRYAGQDAPVPMAKMAMARSDMGHADTVAEPSFEPGESTVSMRMVAKVRFK